MTTGYVLNLSGGMERILCDLDASGNVTAWYVHGPDLGYRVGTTNGLTCYHADAMANVIALTGPGGTNLAQYAYTPYGRVLGSTNLQPLAFSPQPFLFVGSQGVMEDFPGLYFMRARYYSADAGVFLSTDPVKHIGPGWRPMAYGYTQGNPLTYTDPEGTRSRLEQAMRVAQAQRDAIWAHYQADIDDIEVQFWESLAGVPEALLGVATANVWKVGTGLANEAAPLFSLLGYKDTATAVKTSASIVGTASGIVSTAKDIGGMISSAKILGPALQQTGVKWNNVGKGDPLSGPGKLWANLSVPFAEEGSEVLRSSAGNLGSGGRTSPSGPSGGGGSLAGPAVTSFSVASALNSVQSVVPKTGGVTTPMISGGGGDGNNAFSQVVNSVSKAASNAANSITQAVKNVVTNVGQAISTAVSTVTSWVGSLWGGGH